VDESKTWLDWASEIKDKVVGDSEIKDNIMSNIIIIINFQNPESMRMQTIRNTGLKRSHIA